jgi:hypothetical protein
VSIKKTCSFCLCLVHSQVKQSLLPSFFFCASFFSAIICAPRRFRVLHHLFCSGALSSHLILMRQGHDENEHMTEVKWNGVCEVWESSHMHTHMSKMVPLPFFFAEAAHRRALDNKGQHISTSIFVVAVIECGTLRIFAV